MRNLDVLIKFVPLLKSSYLQLTKSFKHGIAIKLISELSPLQSGLNTCDLFVEKR
jgi:hypothetical protein